MSGIVWRYQDKHLTHEPTLKLFELRLCRLNRSSLKRSRESWNVNELIGIVQRPTETGAAMGGDHEDGGI